MKVLILGDCDQLIKFILFGNEENESEDGHKGKKRRKRFESRHIPRNIFWPGEILPRKDDIEIKIKNNMELAIYHCKGKFQLINL
jgi:hypothetical protein